MLVPSVRWYFFVFRNFVGKLCVSWAFPLVECVAVWMPMLTHIHTSGTTLLLDSCLEGCIFTSLFGFVWENCTTHATLCINFLLFGCFRLNFLKIYATIFGIYEG